MEIGSSTSRTRGIQPASRPSRVPNIMARKKPQNSSCSEPSTSCQISSGFSTNTWKSPSGDGISRSFCTVPVLYAISQTAKNVNSTTAISDALFFRVTCTAAVYSRKAIASTAIYALLS